MELIDKRLCRVFDKITDRLQEKQTLSLRKLSSSRKEEVQFGRFVGNNKVTVELLEQQLYSNMQNKGFYIHPVLAIDAVSYGCYGIASLEFVTRPWTEQELTRTESCA